MRGHVHEFDPITGADRIVDVGQPVGAVALTERGDWIVAARDGFHRVDPQSGRLTLVAHVEADEPDTRMNDGAVDARGRFWAGTMGMDGQRGRGTLYRLDPDGSVHAMLAPVSISNGLDWSPDDRLMYYIDLVTRRVDVFDFDADAGAIANRRTFVTIEDGAGWPDGLIVDAAGDVWVALWEGAAVRRYSPGGALRETFAFPVSRTTKCAFGGAHLDELYVTTAWIGLDEAGRGAEPLAGAVFRLRPGARGRAARRFAG
jgi:sugar lactone lactonase YvrE